MLQVSMRCTDPTIGQFLYDYASGKLADKEIHIFEIHIMMCHSCFSLAYEYQIVTELLDSDTEVAEYIKELSQHSLGVNSTRRIIFRSHSNTRTALTFATMFVFILATLGSFLLRSVLYSTLENDLTLSSGDIGPCVAEFVLKDKAMSAITISCPLNSTEKRYLRWELVGGMNRDHVVYGQPIAASTEPVQVTVPNHFLRANLDRGAICELRVIEYQENGPIIQCNWLVEIT